MPSINRIRVNNVKYNFGTQFYDDFTMRMYGKNTLYDLANGGGKSVLMLLLLQNMIPNCTLDEKQPIEKLFRTGNGNTTIHSLIEWKLDEADSTEGYRYMTTGFCARKAKEAEGEPDNKKDVAAVEYFNYCIFYREYNKNDIINLPLVKDGERMTFQGLRSYLKELEHRDMGLMVRIFDRKGEYQRFISDYGLHGSQWEIVRGINKTEGHVRTYFENNYKTTRKVVEDLLIEEIIEKAFMVKTERDENGSDSMAKMLMDIKEQLTVLAGRKKQIAGYGHQIELIEVLADKVASFMELYQEQSRLSGIIADICVTGAEFAKNDEARMEELARARDEKYEQKNRQRERIECLKVSKDKRQLEELQEEAHSLEKKLSDCRARLDELLSDLKIKESINEYVEYIDDRKKYKQHEAVVKTMMSESSFDEKLLYTYVYNIKMRMDVVLTDIRGQMNELAEQIEQARAKKEYQAKLLSEAQIALAVAENAKKTADAEVAVLSGKLSDIRMSMNQIKFTKLSQQMDDSKQELNTIQDKIDESRKTIEENNTLIKKENQSLVILEIKKQENDRLITDIAEKEQEYKNAWDKLDNIRIVYSGGISGSSAGDIEDLARIISDRITGTVLEIAGFKEKLADSRKVIERLKEGRIIGISQAAAKVIDYIETRHNITAMYGMDYLSALKAEQQITLLNANPELPYGVLVKEFETVKDDPNIRNIDTGSECVRIYDMEAMSEHSLIYGENVISIHASSEYLTAEDTVYRLAEAEENRCKEYEQQLEIKNEMLEVYRQDHEFVLKAADSEFLNAGQRLIEAKELDAVLTADIDSRRERIKGYQHIILSKEQAIKEMQDEYEKCLADINRLFTVEQLTELITEQEAIADKNRLDIERLREQVNALTDAADDGDKASSEAEARRKMLDKRLAELTDEWDTNYKAYYNVDEEYDVLTISDDELKARFTAMIAMGSEDAKAIEDKRLLMDTLRISMERSLKNIEKRGVSIKTLAEYESKNLLYISDEEVLGSCRKGIDDAEDRIIECEKLLRDKLSEINRLEGSISYAVQNIEAAFGAYAEEPASLSEITANLENGEELLTRLEQEAKACDDEYRRYFRQQGYMVDLYKDVKRIVITNDISLENAKPVLEDKDKLRDIFEENLMLFDRSNKSLERAKNELLKFKGNTAASLDQMEVYELASTIRDDVVIPSDYEQAKELMRNLKSIVEYIRLECDRVEKSLVDMETIKANFEEQCLQRCLDVKTELDKLPKLSRIIVDGEAIQMVGLTVPYVKEEFLRQRMSEYIDRIVAQADDYDNDRERMKYIRNSLVLKKLFGVIVTDMNKIKLNLYKRERIKEQSRYLRYEEAVGSTGQSQGIYIQFLISIIHYISGMYQTGNDDIRTKTIFIDNPFGAAKDVYIWEPIFALLKANNVQLIVPARGATPAITGRFDVNYILGQQMSGGRQLTVVTDYTSRVDQDELEYRDLEYEQVSFDFI